MTKHIILVIFTLLLFNCKEEIELETQNFENVLVIEGTLTNQLEFQKIKLSRTFFLEGDDEVLENNAIVKVIDDQGNTFNFTQNSNGFYTSNIQFQALPNILYNLLITTSNGKNYKSIATELTPVSQIDNLYAEYDAVEENIEVLVDSENANNNAQYFKYEYEETFKIIVPFHSQYNAKPINIFNNGATYDIELVQKTEDESLCFTTNPSIDIIQTATDQLENDNISGFPVRKIDKDDSILRERYSILVKQYVQSIEAYNYYNTIRDLSISESVLSETQPGFVIGNVKSLDDEDEKVIGFFEVASVSSARIFFSYLDFGILQPSYLYDCEYITDNTGIFNGNRNHLKLDYNITGGPGVPDQRADLYASLTNFEPYKYFSHVGSTYEIVSPLCGDCTSFSSNIQPDFWLD